VFRRWSSILAFLALAVVLWWAYESLRLPSGVEANGPEDWLPRLSLVASIVSLLTGLVGLAVKILELRQKPA
jgi:purine-cytosine permease-like protein